MNIANIYKMIDHLEKSVPDDRFGMVCYRTANADRVNHECKSIGCIIGHCTILDKNFENPSYFREPVLKGILFYGWSIEFTGIQIDEIWEWCFSENWWCIDNTKKGAINRLKYLMKIRETCKDDVECHEELIYSIKGLGDLTFSSFIEHFDDEYDIEPWIDEEDRLEFKNWYKTEILNLDN